MAASVKEKNMPTISSNLYGGLQKWVNRASLSIRERKRSRRNSDVSQTMHRPNPSDIYGYDDGNTAKIVPIHTRSRSTPVEMPELPQNYLNIEQSLRNSTDGRKPQYQQEVLLEPRRRQGSKDYATVGSYKERNIDLGSRPLLRNCSKSESSLVDAARRSDTGRKKFQTAPKQRVIRTNSQGTEESFEGDSTSDLDVNHNVNKTSKGSRVSHKTNKRDKVQTDGSKVDSNGANKLNLRNSSSYDKTAKDVKSRLDRWGEKSSGFKDMRQSSLESTSSSEEMFDLITAGKQNRKKISNETRELRELQSALEELVSGCGSRKSSGTDAEKTEDSIEAINIRASRKVSLQNTEAVFNKASESDNYCSQSVRQNEYQLKKCGSSSGSNYSGGSIADEVIEEKYDVKVNSELEESYDSVDGKVMEFNGFNGIRDEGLTSESENEAHTRNSMSCDFDIGRETENARALDNKNPSATPESLKTRTNKVTKSVSSSTLRCQNINEKECQHESQRSKYFAQEDNGSSSDETKQTDENKLFCKQNPVGGMKDKDEQSAQQRPARSSKNHRAPVLPSSSSPERKAKKPRDVVFNNDDLAAFAEECVRHANKKTRTTKRESKSDSEEEKRSLEINFIYIKNDTQAKDNVRSYPEQIHRKSSTHPKSSYDKNLLSYITLSDNDMENEPSDNLKILRQKRNSLDSLDGRVLFEGGLEPNFVQDQKDLKNNEKEPSSDGIPQAEEDLAAENPGTGLRKFPSMPLFYVPKDFEHSGEFKVNKSSFRKSIWKRFTKSKPRQSENHRVNQHIKSKRSGQEISSSQLVDPFYHGENVSEEKDLEPVMRKKAWTLSTTKISRPVSQRRPSLETRQTAPVLKVEKPVAEKLNEYVVIPPKNDDESQC